MLFEKSFRKPIQEHGVPELPCSTQSICPDCDETIEASLYERDGQVWMAKTCPEHGSYQELICSDRDFFLKRRRTHFEQPSGVQTPHTPSHSNCPNDCGLCSQHLSTPCMINIDLTNRCNMRCPICFANANATGQVCEISLEQLDMMLDKAMAIKPHPPLSIQYAGGEPTIHPHFLEALRMAKDKGVLDIQVATNGLRFAKSQKFTEAAAEAGLDVAYLQFDGVSDDIYEQSRGRPLWETKQQAIENMRRAGIMVTLVPTIVRGLNDHQLGDILKFAIDNSDVVTAVSFQPVSLTGRIDHSRRLEMRYTMADMARDLQEQTGILNMYEDWYPFSIINPISRLLEAVTGTPKIRFSCHAHCGAASYLLIDRQTGTATPITRFLDIESAMKDLNTEAEAVEQHASWRKKLTKLQIMRKLKKHFNPDLAPEGLEFDHLIDFVNKFVESGDKPKERHHGHVYHLIGDRFDVMLMAAMHFQDKYNFEIDRVRHCVIHYAAPDGKFYPFCTWNSGPCHRYTVEQAFSKPLKQAEETIAETSS